MSQRTLSYCDCFSREEVPLLTAEQDSEQVSLQAEVHPNLAPLAGLAPALAENPPALLSRPDEESVLQFTCAIYYVLEGEDHFMNVEVARLGPATRKAFVDYTTEDSSAKAGLKYDAVKGTLQFNPGDTIKTIAVPILNNDSWDATLEFSMRLSNARGAQLGRYLNECRVTVIDDDLFPTQKHEEDFRILSNEDCAEGIEPPEHINALSLFVEYLKLMLRDKHIRQQIYCHIAIDFVKGFYYFLTIYLQVYLVDVVLSSEVGGEGEGGEEGGKEEGSEEMPERRLMMHGLRAGVAVAARLLGEEGGEEEEEGPSFMIHTLIVPQRRTTAIIVACIYVFPMALLHLGDYIKNYLGLKQHLRKILQSNLLRKFLYYAEGVRLHIKPENVTLALMRDVKEVVDIGFMKLLAVAGILIKLGFALLFILAENKLAAIPLVVCPAILLTWLAFRQKTIIEVNEKMADREDACLKILNETVTHFRLIAEFYLRPWTVDSYDSFLQKLHHSEKESGAIFTNNLYLAPWLTALTVGTYMVIGSTAVSTVGGWIKLGIFLATINIFKEIGAEIQEIYLECMEIQKSFGPLVKIATYMNLPTDLKTRKEVNRKRRTMGETLRQEMRDTLSGKKGENGSAAGPPGAFAADLVNIEVENLSYRYPNSDKEVLRAISLTIVQGRMHCIVGPANAGKATLLKLIGQVLLPQQGSGSIFVPPHLRILHASQDIVILEGSFLWNTVLNQASNKEGLDKVGGLDRVLSILDRLKMGGDMKERLKRDVEQWKKTGNIIHPSDDGTHLHHHPPAEETSWHSRLSHTGLARMALLRAMVMNPEVLIMHKPFVNFNDSEVVDFSKMLKQHVEEKGLYMPPELRRFRRPRTVLFSTGTRLGMQAASDIFRVHDGTLEVIDANQVKDSDRF
eukprot:TRINITY_DN6916_c0_g1_i2.p1 TRINITY_DN6916_c0_g1~~TRINITY_DN6916_c0_g1_i2.p1  ORF type:complete len:907 (-),score=214.76 TRINITY_DN6916_c0_g1_i2:75-2795(-)